MKEGTLAVSWELLQAIGILGGFWLAALLVHLFLGHIVGPYLRRTATALDGPILRTLRRLLSWALVLSGIYYAASSLPWATDNPRVADLLGRGLGVAWVLLALTSALRIFNALVTWQVQRLAEQEEERRDRVYQAALLRKVVNILVLIFGLLYLLRTAGIDISPLLASGAIGGLAVALAAQDTLSNLFAGFYLTLDRPIRVGDFVRLESGQEGYVEEIGWRNTRVRLLPNNLVVIPNAKLSQSILINYYLPVPDMSVYIPCGVSYDSDLEQVEAVVLEVAGNVLQRVAGADPTWEPVVRWKEFGDSAIQFVTVLRVKEFGAQFLLQSDFIKALHRRFRAERIEIPFPMRTLQIQGLFRSDTPEQNALYRDGAGLATPIR